MAFLRSGNVERMLSRLLRLGVAAICSAAELAHKVEVGRGHRVEVLAVGFVGAEVIPLLFARGAVYASGGEATYTCCLQKQTIV